MLAAAQLAIVEEACTAVLVLTEGFGDEEFLRSRLTRAEAARQLATIASTLAHMPPGLRRRLPELDWEGWRACMHHMGAGGGPAQDEALWFAVRSLVPATLTWLRVHRRGQPELFAFQL
ncbi:hypothetical protein [Caldimonas tepidiphila]|uniref:hypothetical protein n=1 Tax=Caldimonas tepidiphila TaxID=2315841 RepID=UPI000E5C26EB|nr:hypothetical protein [Caldimonas tepidiphila]